MKTEEVTEVTLMAYVDGELPPAKRHEVEEHIRASSEAAELVALLKASRVDYQGAFATQNLPPVPDSLTQKIAAMSRAHAGKTAAPTVASAVNDSAMPASAKAPAAPVRSRLRTVPAWLAAACVAGAFCGGLFLRLGPLLEHGAPGSTVASNLSPWVQAATGYQKLYTRNTLAYVNETAETSSKTVDDIRRDDGLALRIPDLRSAGLTFKTVQRLRFNNKPLVQIVYQPEKGEPVALCVMKDVKPDQAVSGQDVDAMRVVTWRQAELSYALIGKPDGVDLNALGKRISNREVEQLFGDADSVFPSIASVS
ncbi:transmembrane anti-sigma factor [Caballeronia sordidicola]|uniref:Transmembrane anti-sigma factor n=1 Tax=Caballeronia sordidicola TaxID=196367 RepID=A0A158IA33_CABSO|nr:zf-HC2 domain-containing protein [Caballeronia sordidicola]SAL53317.1 transmembrane anti-sigma factor [Caballeronia sordidicola]